MEQILQNNNSNNKEGSKQTNKQTKGRITMYEEREENKR